MKNPIIVLTGPTASGKTAMSFDLAKKYNAEIICADSMTVYREMDIGTDKPTLNTKFEDGYIINGVRHHLLDILNPNEEFNAALFKNRVAKIVTDIQARGKVPMLVGGSLLYIDSYIYDFQMSEVRPDPKLRAELEQKTSAELFEQLVSLDPDAEWTVDKHNRRRVIRALEVCLNSGEPFTTQQKKRVLPDNVVYLAVSRERQELYARINQRVNEMMIEGFLAETEALYKKYDRSTALQATGYCQLIQYLDGEITLPEAIEKTKQSHRNFAKRQLTWLRRNPDVKYVKNVAEAESELDKFLGR